MIALIRNDSKFVVNNGKKKQSEENIERSSKFYLRIL